MNHPLPRGWQKVRLGDICDINVNSLKENTNKNYQFKYIDLSSVKNGIIDFPNNYITFKNAPSRAKRIIKIDDVIMATVRPNLKGFAYISFDPKEYICSTGFAVLTSKSEICMKYIYQILYANYIEKQISNMLVGSNYPALNTSDILNIKILLPPIDEQKRIADILSTFDDLIENLNKLIEKKEIYKKGVMQRVLTGEVRFNGFKDEWETMRIGDICEYKNGNSFENYIDENGKLFLITLDSITIDGRLKNNHKKINIDTKELLSKNDIVMILSDIAHGYFLGLTAVIDKDNCYVLNQRVALLKPNNIIVNSYFLSKLININQKYFKKYGQGSSQQNLQKKSVENFIVKIPSLEEQNKIAELLTLIDKDIEILKQILQLRKLQKKGVMQKLLTGEVRI